MIRILDLSSLTAFHYVFTRNRLSIYTKFWYKKLRFHVNWARLYRRVNTSQGVMSYKTLKTSLECDFVKFTINISARVSTLTAFLLFTQQRVYTWVRWIVFFNLRRKKIKNTKGLTELVWSGQLAIWGQSKILLRKPAPECRR